MFKEDPEPQKQRFGYQGPTEKQPEKNRQNPPFENSWSRFENTQQSQSNDFVVGTSSLAQNKNIEMTQKPTNRMETMMMSPIGETSKHKIEEE